MKISEGSNATPESDPPGSAGAERERFVWQSLAPALLGPLKVAIIEALLWVGQPLSPAGLQESLALEERKLALVRYHAEYLAEAGVLEMLEPADGDEEARFFFPPTPKPSP